MLEFISFILKIMFNLIRINGFNPKI